MNDRTPVNREPLSAMAAFERAEMVLGPNSAMQNLRTYADPDKMWDFHDPKIAVVKKLAEMGQTRFVNIAQKYDDSKIVLALYAGDGIVVKVITHHDLPHTEDVIFHVPAIFSTEVESEDRKFSIKFYPWVAPGDVSQFDVDEFGKRLNQLGLEFTNGDGNPRNVHRLPDKAKTLVGIDSCMFQGSNLRVGLIDPWHQYMHELYPIYKEGVIKPQTDNTNFSFHSIHNREANLAGFDPALYDPIIRTKEPRSQNFVSRWIPGLDQG